MLRRMIDRLKAFRDVADEVARGKAVQTIEAEVEELEHIFGLIVLGSFVGLPSPPMHIALDLAPHMERELALMVQNVETANEPISRLFSIFGID
ncbi:MAG: hypothetical protein VR64_06050 [Desulfatitalea sp. BRH_c12]|nr:MAG: hypothetical protein VR64_06050 [Desulfatitalea sp. BRH_c12]